MSLSQPDTNQSQRSSRLLLLFSAVVAVYCIWIMSLPLFPSQDGPLHLYYANIFGLFLTHSPGAYARYYHVGSYLPPYALYYYMLFALNKAVPLTTADQLIICGSIILNAFGFRYLAKRVGPGGEVAAFLFLPLLLNWPLVMGFINFTLSFGVGLFAAGIWSRFDDGRARLRQASFIALLYVMTLTHPLPLLMLLVGCSVDLVIRFLRVIQDGPAGAVVRRLLPRLLCLGAAIPAALYIRRFTINHVIPQTAEAKLFRRIITDTVLFSRGWGLFAFTGDTKYVILYRLGVQLLSLAALILGVLHARSCWRARRLDAPSLWLGAALISIIFLPLLPRELNGSYYVGERFALGVYALIALSASGTPPKANRAAQALVGFSTLLSLAALSIAFVRIGTAAKRIAVLTTPAQTTPGELGVLFQTGTYVRRDFAYSPFMWAGMHYFRVNGLVLYNSPWLDGPQIPLKPNEQTGLLEATYQQTAPNEQLEKMEFQLGAHWNPRTASFFMLEKTTPRLKPKADEKDWLQMHLPVPDLNLGQCDPRQWYCIVPRQ